MRCVVTGASGFLGSWLVRHLVAEGHTVAAFVREGVPAIRGATNVRGSFENTSRLRDHLKTEPVDVFFHLAWFGVTSALRNHIDQIGLNVIASVRLCEMARDAGCRHWIGVGSQAEYGPHEGILQESLATKPVTVYGVAKLTSGMLTAKIAEVAGMRHTWLRLLAVYGPGDDARHFIPSLIQTLCSGGIPALTKGEQLWDYLYVEDAAEAIVRVAVSQAAGVFNLASGKTVELRALAERIRDEIDPLLPLELGALPYLPDQVMHLEADISRLQAVTGWRPRTSLAEGLQRTVAWWKAHRAYLESTWDGAP